jgi:hypothetical protein
MACHFAYEAVNNRLARLQKINNYFLGAEKKKMHFPHKSKRKRPWGVVTDLSCQTIA